MEPFLHISATDGTLTRERESPPAPDLAERQAPVETAALRGRAAVFVGTTIALGAAVCATSVVDVLTKPLAPEWLALLLLTAVAGWATLRIPAMPISFSISDTFSIISALVVGPSAGALTAALDGLVVSCRMARTRRSLHRVLFNVAGPAVAIWVAGRVFFMLAAPNPLHPGTFGALRLLALLSVFACVNFALNTGMVAAAVAFDRRKPVLTIWKEHFASLWVTHLGGVFAAMLMLVLSGVHSGRSDGPPISILEVLILIAPLPVILYVTFRHALGRAADQITQLGRMNKVYVGAIEALAQAIDAKDQVTHDHIRRVQHNAVRLARALRVEDDMEIQAIKAAALLHDVGKLGVPEHILNKPGRLSTSEFEIMKRHAPIGADILSMIGFPYPVVPIVRHHHESWDGSGYPDGITGDRIPIGARILAVVDCFDALTSDRPYRRRLDDQDALQILADRRGTMYDPGVVDAFFALHEADTGRVLEDRTTAGERAAAPAITSPLPASASSPVTPELEAFYEIGQALRRDTANADLGATLWTHLSAHVPATAFVYFVYEEASDALTPCYAAGDATIARDERIALGDRLSGWVAASQQAILNSDARLDLDVDSREDSPLRSALAVPIGSGPHVTGVLTFYSREPDGFSDDHLRIARASAHVVASHRARQVSSAASKPAA